MKRIILSLAACAALAALGSAASPAAAQDKPMVAVWGADIEQVREQLVPVCAAGFEVRRFDPAKLPGVQDHRQIDCRGFAFMGAPRTAEFVFAEGHLQLVWILMEAADGGRVTAGLRERFGAPAVDNPGVTAFPAGRAAWRKDKPEVLFYAPQLDEMMKQFLGL